MLAKGNVQKAVLVFEFFVVVLHWERRVDDLVFHKEINGLIRVDLQIFAQHDSYFAHWRHSRNQKSKDYSLVIPLNLDLLTF